MGDSVMFIFLSQQWLNCSLSCLPYH
uniref:Uncharacterized protein n=1 Tax=Rhizophora mucronata TaxID=61149 RepID=A0A2P2N7Q6_RHIMU